MVRKTGLKVRVKMNRKWRSVVIKLKLETAKGYWWWVSGVGERSKLKHSSRLAVHFLSLFWYYGCTDHIIYHHNVLQVLPSTKKIIITLLKIKMKDLLRMDFTLSCHTLKCVWIWYIKKVLQWFINYCILCTHKYTFNSTDGTQLTHTQTNKT